MQPKIHQCPRELAKGKFHMEESYVKNMPGSTLQAELGPCSLLSGLWDEILVLLSLFLEPNPEVLSSPNLNNANQAHRGYNTQLTPTKLPMASSFPASKRTSRIWISL